MKKTILITGMSGTGKSTIGKSLRAGGYTVHDIEIIPGMFETTDSRTGEVITEWNTNDLNQIKHLVFACSREKLSQLMEEETDRISFYCGTATNITDIVPLFDKVILLQASPDNVRHRLSTRETHDFARDPEMQDWIIEIKKSFEDSLTQLGAVVIDANGTLEETLTKVLSVTEKP